MALQPKIYRRNSAEILWLAGLWEGEGSFLITGKRYKSPRMQLKMCDKDVICRAADLMGYTGKIYSYQPEPKGWSRNYMLVLEGSDAVIWMLRLLPFMGKRRTRQIWATLTAYGKKPPGGHMLRPGIRRFHRMWYSRETTLPPGASN